jgi:DNA repair protein RadD
MGSGVMQLRPYQQDIVEKLRAKYSSGSRSVVCVLPTGGGKTVVASAIIRSARARGRRVLFAAHRAELISQSVRKLESAGITDLRIIQAASDLGARNAPVIVASIQTLASKRWREQLPDVDFLILDECHHTPAKTWAGIASRYADAQLLGLTATPQRADGKPLGDIFDALVVGATVRELTDRGHLVPCRVFAPTDTLDTKQIAQSPLDAYRKLGDGQRAVVFCVTVEHAQRVADEMNAGGVACAVIHGDMSKDARRTALADLDAGRIRAVASCHVLTEGWDSPSVAVCILARKPQHTGLYLQMVGRVLRPAPQKTHATLIDLCGSVHDHGPPDLDREYSLDGKGISKPDREAIRQCMSCGAVFRAGPAACPVCQVEMPRKPVVLPVAIGSDLVNLADLPKLKPRTVTLSITAKFPSTCRECRGRIEQGQQIYWVPGVKGARHADCQAVAA